MVKESDKDKKIKILMEDIALLEDHVQDLFSFTPLGVFFVSPKGVILEVNSALESITGENAYNLIGEFSNKILPAEIFDETVEKGSVVGKKTIVRRVDGGTVPVNVFSKARKMKDGKVVGYFFAFLDITDIEKINDELKDSKKVLEIRVAARTKELQELTENLEAQIHKRTVELQDKIEELEKINKLMVGRELKMIEMKEKLNRANK